MKNYQEEAKKLLDKWYENETKILEEYKVADIQYYQEHSQKLDGKSPSLIQSNKNKQWYFTELEKLRKKYNMDTKN